jgi:hypothetical protein
MKEMVDSRSRLKKKYDDFFAAGGSPDQFLLHEKFTRVKRPSP